MKFRGKVALVTGASRGIGRAIALALAREGADVALNCSTSVKAAEEVSQEIKRQGRRAIVIQADVSSKPAVEKMVQRVVDQLGKIDILVNNAGLSVVGPSSELAEDKWRRGIDVMLTGVFFCSQAAGNEMIKQKSGKIINIASINGVVAFPERACYCAAKAGVMALTKVLGSEWARYNINVNAVAPGYVETELVKDLANAGTLNLNELANRTPNGRLAKADEVADLVVFLASEESKYIQGQTVIMDGGWTAYGYLESWLRNKL
ncbi:MAG: 3-oxoacyl-ACP reductase FabG [candidate division KSB1 bacterium]|nr:3-oxoacyl-ACP reductase FabG [candidate division KSB1 bacterium]